MYFNHVGTLYDSLYVRLPCESGKKAVSLCQAISKQVTQCLHARAIDCTNGTSGYIRVLSPQGLLSSNMRALPLEHACIAARTRMHCPSSTRVFPLVHASISLASATLH